MADNVLKTNQDEINSVKTWSVILGISMIVLGLFTIAFSVFTTFVSVLFMGIVLFLRGVFEVVESFLTYRNEHFWQRLLIGILSLGVGIFLIGRPVIGAATLTILIASFLIVIGLYRAIGSAIIKPHNWEWIMLSGILSVVLGFLIWSEWPAATFWLIGLLIGVEILSRGIELTMIPFIVKKEEKEIRSGFGKPAMGH